MAGAIISQVSCHWGTPESLLEPTRYVFGGQIDLDPCGNRFSTARVDAQTQIWLPEEADTFITEQRQECTHPSLPTFVTVGDGLKYDWTKHKNVFCNPPYGRSKATGTSIYNWIEKCAKSGGAGAPGITLIPAATGTKHWQQIVFRMASKICFLKGRVKFLLPGKDNVSTTPSAMVLFGGDEAMLSRFDEAFSPLGKVI